MKILLLFDKKAAGCKVHTVCVCQREKWLTQDITEYIKDAMELLTSNLDLRMWKYSKREHRLHLK